MSPRELCELGDKEHIREYWDNDPCGTRGISYPEGTLEYYEAVMAEKRRLCCFVEGFAEFHKWQGKKVLEVGCGVGSDLVRFAQAGAMVTGIDLSAKSVFLAGKRLELYGLQGNALAADAEYIPFGDGIFDLVYSNGVLHHTPNIGKAIMEIYRVLKRNGEMRVMLYHRRSLVALQMWVLFGLLAGKPFRGLDDIFVKHHESPGTRAYSVSEVRRLFARFRDVTAQVIVTPYDLRYRRDGYLPFWIGKLIPSCLGWNILIRGRK